jgi:hypothetical protein
MRLAAILAVVIAAYIALSRNVGGAAPAPGPAPRQAQSVHQYLRAMGLDEEQIADAAKGEPAVRLLPSENDRDVVVFGAVAIQLSRAAYLAHALDSGRLIGAGAHRFHLIAEPATAADMQDVEFDGSEYRDARKCHPGDCKFKLPASAMKEFAQEVVWSGSDAKPQADALLRRDLLRLVTGYRARGDSALFTYDDTRGTRAADAFAGLLAQSNDLYPSSPELLRYLASYPSGRPADTRDLLYWSDDHHPGLRPTLTVNHVVIYSPPTGAAVIARKQIYANHYFEGALELLTVAPDPTESRSYLILVRRLRFDNLPGGLFNIRRRVRNKMIDITRADLARERSDAEKRER